MTFSSSRMTKFLGRISLCVISGFLARLAFPKPAFSFLAYVALVPVLLLLLRISRPRQGFLYGLCFGFTFYYSNIFWLNTLATYNPYIPIGIFLLGAYLGLYGGIFGWATVLLKNRSPRLFFILIPSVWIMLEYLRNVGQLAFPWSDLSSTQSKNMLLIQICDITGIWGVSFLIMMINVSLALLADTVLSKKILPAKQKEGKVKAAIHVPLPYLPGVIVSLSVLCFILVYGAVRFGRDYEGEKEIRVAVLQPDIPQKIKYASYAGTEKERERLYSFLESVNFEMLKELNDPSVDLVVLPESAFTKPMFNYQKEALAKLGEESRRLSAGILVGANREVFYNKAGEIARPGEEIAEYDAYNSCWYILPSGSLSAETYDKIHLVPFGEHLPYFDLIPGFQRIIVQTGSFLKGKNYTLFPVQARDKNGEKTGDLHFATVICFESSFNWLFRRFAKRGADFFVIVTNDGWYEDSAGPYQHFDLAVFRAIETRRWIVRCSNRGVSCVISPRGEILHRTNLNTRASILASFCPGQNHTCHEWTGDLFVYILLFLLIGESLFHFQRTRKKKNSS